MDSAFLSLMLFKLLLHIDMAFLKQYNEVDYEAELKFKCLRALVAKWRAIQHEIIWYHVGK